MTTKLAYTVGVSKQGYSESRLFSKDCFKDGNTLLLSAVFNAQTKSGQMVSSHYETLIPINDMDKIDDIKMEQLKKSFRNTLGGAMSHFTNDFYSRLDDKDINAMAFGKHLFMPFIMQSVIKTDPRTMQQHWFAMIKTSEMFLRSLPKLLDDNAANIDRISDYRTCQVTISRNSPAPQN